MTNEEAIRVLRWALNLLEGYNYIVDGYGTVDPSAKVDAFSTAIKAIEKQIQHKPTDRRRLSNIADGGNCRKCGWFITQAFEFCPHCGQAIDWSDT